MGPYGYGTSKVDNVCVSCGVRGYLYDLAWSPTGTHLATAGTDTCVTIWDMAGGTRPRVCVDITG